MLRRMTADASVVSSRARHPEWRVRVDGDADVAFTSNSKRRATSGGAVRYGAHTWDCYSVTQPIVALSSGESEFHATGSTASSGPQCKAFLAECFHNKQRHVPTCWRRHSWTSADAAVMDSRTPERRFRWQKGGDGEA